MYVCSLLWKVVPKHYVNVHFMSALIDDVMCVCVANVTHDTLCYGYAKSMRYTV